MYNFKFKTIILGSKSLLVFSCHNTLNLGTYQFVFLPMHKKRQHTSETTVKLINDIIKLRSKKDRKFQKDFMENDKKF